MSNTTIYFVRVEFLANSISVSVPVLPNFSKNVLPTVLSYSTIKLTTNYCSRFLFCSTKCLVIFYIKV